VVCPVSIDHRCRFRLRGRFRDRGCQIAPYAIDPNLSPTECIVLDHHLTNAITAAALERVKVEPHARRRAVNKHHVSPAVRASATRDLNIDAAGH
jgi:hypothetical protein